MQLYGTRPQDRLWPRLRTYYDRRPPCKSKVGGNCRNEVCFSSHYPFLHIPVELFTPLPSRVSAYPTCVC